MYVIRKYDRNNKPHFKTYDGWTEYNEGLSIDLSDVLRFTATERELNQHLLNRHEQFVWFGCYKELEQ